MTNFLWLFRSSLSFNTTGKTGSTFAYKAPKTATVAEKCDCRRKRRDNGDSRRIWRQCGQALKIQAVAWRSEGESRGRTADQPGGAAKMEVIRGIRNLTTFWGGKIQFRAPITHDIRR